MPVQTNHEWFEVRQFSHGVVGIGEPGHVEDVKSYLVAGDDLALLFDSGMGVANIKGVVDRLTDKPVLLVNSHGHLDHIGDNWRFERRWAHPLEVEGIEAGIGNQRLRRFLGPDTFTNSPPAGLNVETFEIPGTSVERTIDESDQIDIGGRTFDVLHTPGHSAGSISLFEPETGILLAGDAVYEGPLFAHHSDANAREYRRTLERLAGLVPDLSVIYPSHNRYPLEPPFVVDVHHAMEEIWDGRETDLEEGGRVHWSFGGFSFSFRDSWKDE